MELTQVINKSDLSALEIETFEIEELATLDANVPWFVATSSTSSSCCCG